MADSMHWIAGAPKAKFSGHAGSDGHCRPRYFRWRSPPFAMAPMITIAQALFEREQSLLNAVGRALENRRLKVENARIKLIWRLVEARTDQLQAAMADLECSYDITLQAPGDALDLKDAETEATPAASTALPRATAAPWACLANKSRDRRGAFLHDIGKWPSDNIIRKPGKLDDNDAPS